MTARGSCDCGAVKLEATAPLSMRSRSGRAEIEDGGLEQAGHGVLAIAQVVHLRRRRLIGWQQLRDWLRDALMGWCLLGAEPTAPEESLAPA